MQIALNIIQNCKCSFLVIGRIIDNVWYNASDILGQISPSLQSLFVPAPEFRMGN